MSHAPAHALRRRRGRGLLLELLLLELPRGGRRNGACLCRRCRCRGGGGGALGGCGGSSGRGGQGLQNQQIVMGR